jgi:hypothetical protein
MSARTIRIERGITLRVFRLQHGVARIYGIFTIFLLYGREPMLPIDLELGANTNPRLVMSRTAPDYATHVVTELEKARALVHT